MGGVFDDVEPMTRCDRHQLLHRRRMAGEMDRDDRPRPRRDLSLDVEGIEVQRVRGHVGQYGTRSRMNDRRAGGRERERAGDDLGVRFEILGVEREMERRRTRAHRDRLACADRFGERPFELDRLRTRGEPAGT